jgi:ParB family chromosome partitioning protein
LSSAANRRGLGRGLEVLVGGIEIGAPELLELPVDAIHPNAKQPRKRFDAEAGSGLAESIRRQGVIQPLLVRPRAAGGYEIVAGERRWRAAREAGHATVPAVVREADDRDSLLLGLIENVAREQLTAVEEARAYAVLLDEFGFELGEVAERVGRSKPSVSNRIRLLDLPDVVLGMLERGRAERIVGARGRGACEVGGSQAEAAYPGDARRPGAGGACTRGARAAHRLSSQGRTWPSRARVRRRA